MRLLALTAVVMLAFAANSVLNRMAVAPGWIDPMGFAWLRLLSGAAVLAGLVLWRDGRGWRPQAGIGGIAGLVLYLVGFSMAYAGLDAGSGALILFGMVQVTMFAGALCAGEAVPAARWAGAALALLGLVWLLLPGDSMAGVDPFAAGAMALAGLGWGIYSLAGRRVADPLGATAANFLLAVPVMAGLILILPEASLWPVAQPRGVALAVLSGAVTSGLGYALWYGVLPQLGAARAAVAQLSVPLIAALGGALLLAEVPGWRFAGAAALILGGVALASGQRGLPRR